MGGNENVLMNSFTVLFNVDLLAIGYYMFSICTYVIRFSINCIILFAMKTLALLVWGVYGDESVRVLSSPSGGHLRY